MTSPRRVSRLVPVLLASLGAWLAATTAAAQEIPDTTDARPEVRPSEPIPIDTPAFGLAPADTVPVLARRFRESDADEELAAVPSEDILPRNPRNAAIRAFLVPGWGQVYTGHPWRAALFAAGEIGFGIQGWRWQRKVVDRREQIDELRQAFVDTLTSPPADPLQLEALFRQQPGVNELFSDLEFERDRRDDYYAWAAASVIFAAVDAYVAAQLDPIEVGVEAGERRAWVAVRLGPR